MSNSNDTVEATEHVGNSEKDTAQFNSITITESELSSSIGELTMQSPSAINDGTASGPVSLSQILDREVCVSVSPSENSAVSSTSQKSAPDENFSLQIQSSQKNIVEDCVTSGTIGDNISKVVVDSGDSVNTSGGGCGCVGDIVRGYIKGTGNVEENNTCSMYSTPGYKLPPLGTNRSMGNGTSSGNSSQSSSNKSDKHLGSPSSNKSNMPFGSNKMHQGGVVYPQDYTYMKEKVKELKDKIIGEEEKLDTIQTENNSLKRDLRAKNDEITQLKRENHKLKVSVYYILYLFCFHARIYSLRSVFAVNRNFYHSQQRIFLSISLIFETTLIYSFI